MSNKEKILEYIASYKSPDKIMRNSMGCNESWYNSYYAIKETFSIEEIESMSENEVDNLVRLGDNIAEALY
jgi:hypothetical protein